MLQDDYFRLFFPCEYMKQLLEHMNTTKDIQPAIEWWEFQQWIGIWFLLATTSGHAKEDFWDTQVPD